MERLCLLAMAIKVSFCSVGGSLPVAFSYFCEFFSTKTRGPFVIVLAGFWILGSVFASLLALAIIEPLQGVVYVSMGECACACPFCFS